MTEGDLRHEQATPTAVTETGTALATSGSHAAADQLLAHPHWHKLGPKPKEIAMFIALNEYDPTTGVFSSASNKELARKYPGYTPDQFKHTFAALRKWGMAAPQERFVDCSYGRRQIGTEYRLSDGTTPFRNLKRVKRQRRIAEDRKLRKQAGGRVGKVPFSKADDADIARLVRNRRR